LDTPHASPLREALPWLLIFGALAFLFQIVQPVPWDADTAYHWFVGELIAKDGLPRAFPWTRFSWLADHYSDSEPLFHLLFAALVPLGYVGASRLLGTLLGTATLGAVWGALRAGGVEKPGPWTLIGAMTSGYWILRMVLVRPYLVAIPIAIGLVAAGRRWRWIAALSLVFPLAYIGFHLGIVLVVLAELTRVVAGERFDWRPIAASLVGTAVGLVLHPYFPAILSHFWVENALTLGRATLLAQGEVTVGDEFAPPNAMEFAKGVVLPGLFALVALPFAWRRRRESGALVWTVAAIAMFVLTTRSQRFVEYLVPFATIALGTALPLALRARIGTPLLGVVFLWFVGWSGTGLLPRLQSRTDIVPAEVVAAVDPVLPRGAKVFTCEWGYTGELLRAFPERKYMVALDPMLMFRADPDRYRLWQGLLAHPPAQIARAIRSGLDSDYAICERTREADAIRTALLADTEARLVARKFPFEVWDLTGAPIAGAP
jgi:hypothetical protein